MADGQDLAKDYGRATEEVNAKAQKRGCKQIRTIQMGGSAGGDRFRRCVGVVVVSADASAIRGMRYVQRREPLRHCGGIELRSSGAQRAGDRLPAPDKRTRRKYGLPRQPAGQRAP